MFCHPACRVKQPLTGCSTFVGAIDPGWPGNSLMFVVALHSSESIQLQYHEQVVDENAEKVWAYKGEERKHAC